MNKCRDSGKSLVPNYCTDCGKSINYRSTRCLECFQFGKLNHRYKNGSSLIKKHCLDCGIEISNYTYERCRKCSTVGKKNGHYIDGRSMNKNQCVDCGKIVNYRSPRCPKCSAINRRKSKAKCMDCGVELYDARTTRCRQCDSSFRVGKKHHHFKGGTSKYPIEWTGKIRELIRTRDGYKCQVCGVPQVECMRALDVHHIDGDKTNLNSKNLISVCIQCHRKLHFKKVELCIKK